MGGQIARIERSSSVFHQEIRTQSSRTAFECFIYHFRCRVVAAQENARLSHLNLNLFLSDRGFTRVLCAGHSIKCLRIYIHRGSSLSHKVIFFYLSTLTVDRNTQKVLHEKTTVLFALHIFYYSIFKRKCNVRRDVV
jgi:hypothetical protein